MLDRLGFCNYNRPRALRPAAFIKLRDLRHNDWNADSLYILTKDGETAHALAKVIEEEYWNGEVRVYDDPEEVGTAMGGDDEMGIVQVWWD